MEVEYATRLWRAVRKIVIFFSIIALILVAGFMAWKLSLPGGGKATFGMTTSTTVAPDFTIPRDDITTSTTESPPTTLLDETIESLNVTCRTNVDCGEDAEIRICYKGDVYLQRVSWICRNSGKPDSYCVKKSGFVGVTIMNPAKPIKKCVSGCRDGECL